MTATPSTILGKIGKVVGAELKSQSDALTTHANKTDNPHSVTQTQVGLGNVENTKLSTWAGSGSITTVGTLSSGTVPYSLLSGTPDLNNISGNLTIGGSLTVGGQTTTLNTETVLVEDNIIELNMKSDGDETAQTSGIQVNRGNGQVAIPSFTATNFNVASGSGVGRSASNKWFAEYRNGAQDRVTISPTETRYISFDGTTNVLIESGTTHLDNAQFTDTTVFSMSINTNLDGSGFIQEFALTSSGQAATNADKATIIWDDNSGQATWKFGLGASDADIKVKDVTASGAISVADGTKLAIGNDNIGDLTAFNNALTTAKS